MLNQYRLCVPRTRNLIEVCQFVVLLGLYVAVMARRENRMSTKYDVVEAVFDIYAAGWVGAPFAVVLVSNDFADTRPIRLDSRTRVGRLHPESLVVLGRHVLDNFSCLSGPSPSRPFHFR